ncbi:hypothetical protein L1887_32017 [Cichorium endivia]|nr:hypothetical protein L1887_32017 [Cichorium endivia]
MVETSKGKHDIPTSNESQLVYVYSLKSVSHKQVQINNENWKNRGNYEQSIRKTNYLPQSLQGSDVDGDNDTDNCVNSTAQDENNLMPDEFVSPIRVGEIPIRLDSQLGDQEHVFSKEYSGQQNSNRRNQDGKNMHCFREGIFNIQGACDSNKSDNVRDLKKGLTKADKRFMDKLKRVKNALKEWRKKLNEKENVEYNDSKKKIEELDAIAESRILSSPERLEIIW